MRTSVPDHRHTWVPAPELGCARYYCMCGAAGMRNANGRIVVDPTWHPKGDFDPPDIVHRTGGRKPTLEDYDRRGS
jgi:hypothetical protein